MRLFVALPLADQSAEALTRLVAGVPVGRVVDAANLHLTLAFLGEVSRADLVRLHEALAGLDQPSFTLKFHHLEALGGKQARVLAVRASGPEVLQARLVVQLRAAGFALPRRRFRPHVTLVRLPRHMGAQRQQLLARFLGALNPAPPAPMPVTSFALFASSLHPQGAIYQRLAEYPLG